MDKTKIDWCDSTWNPVTGCLHGCEYCYARGIAKRFSDYSGSFYLTSKEHNDGDVFRPLFVLEEKRYRHINGKSPRYEPYPFGFEPTFHKYRLNDYIGKKGRNIFVCSMADLFGNWVPDSWIEEVFKACEKAPQHNYLFLTKNAKRYTAESTYQILLEYFPVKAWFGATVTTQSDLDSMVVKMPLYKNCFFSIEPMLEKIHIDIGQDVISTIKWIIVGAETGRRKDKVIPKREWIEQIVEDCGKFGIPVFMKSSLSDIWGESLIQEFPKELRKRGL